MKTHTNYCESDIDAHRPDVEDGVAHQRLVAAEAGDREGRQAPDAEALVFPCQQVVGEVDLLVHELERHREARAERLELLQRMTAVCVGRTVNGVERELLQRTTTVAIGRLVRGINLLVHQLKSYQELCASQTPTKSPLDDWSTVLTEDLQLLQTTTTVSVGGQLVKGLDGAACAQRLKLLQRTIAVAVGNDRSNVLIEPQTSTKDNHSLRWTISVKVIGLLLQQLKWNRELQCHPNVLTYITMTKGWQSCSTQSRMPSHLQDLFAGGPCLRGFGDVQSEAVTADGVETEDRRHVRQQAAFCRHAGQTRQRCTETRKDPFGSFLL